MTDTVSLEVLPGSGRLAVEVDGGVAGYVSPGDRLDITPRPAAARVVGLGRTILCQMYPENYSKDSAEGVTTNPPTAFR